jgi:ribosomal protein S18 acetylase RimI-like enzyme
VRLELRDLRRGPGDDKYVWLPFEVNDNFNPDWWDRVPYLEDDPHYVQVLLDGVEVGRVELDHGFRGSKHLGAPKLGDKALEIQFIEVAESCRGQGIGAEVVRLLVERHHDRRFLAMSEDADDFWASLGWDRYDHRDGPQRYRPLFVAPA